MTTNNAYKPAFPDNWDPKMGGLTKREYFAALAMQGFCADGNFMTDVIAETSVKMADALLKELENDN